MAASVLSRAARRIELHRSQPNVSYLTHTSFTSVKNVEVGTNGRTGSLSLEIRSLCRDRHPAEGSRPVGGKKEAGRGSLRRRADCRHSTDRTGDGIRRCRQATDQESSPDKGRRNVFFTMIDRSIPNIHPFGNPGLRADGRAYDGWPPQQARRSDTAFHTRLRRHRRRRRHMTNVSATSPICG